ncbi:ferredoxin [Streptomyces sp. NPDC056503]|uniref:ferredoxin n=1 Tax=Streptomyces sp. NPDC056503 TaxID=3345842 RepID=UPI0036768766
MGDRWRVEVDRGVCIGSGMCVGHAPDGFRLDTARQSHPVRPEADAGERILAAAEGCPVEAILITLADGGEPVYPPEE